MNNNLKEVATEAIKEGHIKIREFYNYLLAHGIRYEPYLDARLHAFGIWKDCGGGYFHHKLHGPVAPFHLTARGQGIKA